MIHQTPPQITPDHINVIKILQSVKSDIVIGGSFALIAFGLLDRKIGDLDIFVDVTDKFNWDQFCDISDDMDGSDFTTDFAGQQIQRLAFKINGIKICCFKMSPIF